MGQLLRAIEEETEPEISGRDNLKTIALIDAAYKAVDAGCAVRIADVME
jgi:predicted dehydrogenase